MHKLGQGLALDHTPILQAGNGIVTQLQAFFSTPANQPSNREKSNGFCSRVSTSIVPRGAFNCVPPRSASAGIAGGATGASPMCHASGDWINVGDRLLISRSVMPLLSTHTRGAVHRV